MSDRKAFVMVAAQGAAMIVNRLDYDEAKKERGVGLDLLNEGERCTGLGVIVAQLCRERLSTHGAGVVLIDGGANIGTYTIPWAQLMGDWGSVIAFEPQEFVFYALCGNIALNNCYNAQARMCALSHCMGSILVPEWDMREPHNFGSLQLGEGTKHVPTITIDSLHLPRLDILKLDLEGMEPDALHGSQSTIKRHRPIIVAEAAICTPQRIIESLPDYAMIGIGVDLLCVPHTAENAKLISAMREVGEKLNMQAA